MRAIYLMGRVLVPVRTLALTDILPLVTAVLDRVEIRRGRARSLEPGAHGELSGPFAVLSAANLALETNAGSLWSSRDYAPSSHSSRVTVWEIIYSVS